MINPMLDDRAVLLAVEGPVARIVLNRPDRHNALETQDIALFRSCLETVDADRDVRVLIVTGVGARTFCAGASLKQIEEGAMSGAVFQTLTDHLATVRMPTICALNGSAYGGGAEIALCCDFRIGVTTARLSVPAARLGLCYPLGGLRRYATRLGLSVAQRILVANEEMDGETLLRVGFLDRLVAPEELVEVTTAMAARLAGLAPLAVRAMKRILTQVAAGALDVEEAHRDIERCLTSEDLREGLRAQRAGEEPRFIGR